MLSEVDKDRAGSVWDAATVETAPVSAGGLAADGAPAAFAAGSEPGFHARGLAAVASPPLIGTASFESVWPGPAPIAGEASSASPATFVPAEGAGAGCVDGAPEKPRAIEMCSVDGAELDPAFQALVPEPLWESAMVFHPPLFDEDVVAPAELACVDAFPT